MSPNMYGYVGPYFPNPRFLQQNFKVTRYKNRWINKKEQCKKVMVKYNVVNLSPSINK